MVDVTSNPGRLISVLRFRFEDKIMVTNNKIRIEYLDTAKGILIILVLFGHALMFSGGDSTGTYLYIRKAIYAFHMMAFFLMSGLLFNKEKWCNSSVIEYCINRTFRLIVPYFFFETIGAAVHVIFNWGNPDTILTIVINILSQRTYVGADWFLPTLFFGEILLFLCCKFFKTRVNIALAVIGMLVVSVIQYSITNIQILLILARTILCFSLLLIGYYTRSLLLSAKPWWCVLASCVLEISLSQINKPVFLHTAIVGNVVVFFVAGYCGTYFILGISEKIHSQFLKYLGKNTLPIMGTHQNIEYLIEYFWGTSTSTVFIVLTFLLMFITELLMVPLLNRFCPRLVGKMDKCCTKIIRQG